MATAVYLIRHAESKLNRTPQYINGRSNETPLTPQGIVQACKLGKFLLENDIVPTSIFSSPAERSKQTGRCCLEAMGIEDDLVICDSLQELDQGEWTGLVRREVYTPEVNAEIKRLGKQFKAPGGESMHEVGVRMLGWAQTTYRNVPANGIEQGLVFTHGVASRCAAGELLGWDQKQIYTAETPNTSITKLVKHDSGWEAAYVGLDPATGQSSWPGGPVPVL